MILLMPSRRMPVILQGQAQGSWLTVTVPTGVVFDVVEVQSIDERLARPTLQW